MAAKKPSKNGRQTNGRFANGNKVSSGRKEGSRNKATLLAQSLLDGQAEKLVQVAIQQAITGDQAMLRLCIERLIPTRKDAPVKIDMPQVNKPL